MYWSTSDRIVYELVHVYFKKPIMQLGADGYFHNIGMARGVLARSSCYCTGNIWYHYPEDYLRWKFDK